MRAYERLLKYVVVKTPSDEANEGTSPSSACQFDLAKLLIKEMEEMGLSDVYLDEYCNVYGKLPATAGCEEKTKIGFIAHLDTVSDYTKHPICPILHPDYDGKDVVLPNGGRTITVDAFPHLPSLKGETLITSDGNTILGVDDKAGIAEILTMCETLIKENIPHGQISVAFTPDEEIGGGAAYLDLERFDAQYAFTLDGGKEGEIEYENFNACSARFDIEGFSVHPGSSKDTMINACLVAMEINNALPSQETPRGTENYEGFYHLCEMKGDCASARLDYIVRDFDEHLFEAKKATLRLIEKNLNEKWGKGTVKLTLKDQYTNMSSIIAGCMHLIDSAKLASENADLVPTVVPIRGGTDGCQLSYRGLPCPNLGVGGYAFHGPYEHTTAEGMDRATNMILELVKIYAK